MGVKTPPNTNSTYKHAKQLRMRIRRPLQVHQLLLQGLPKEVIPTGQDAPASILPAGRRRRLYPVTSSPTPPCRTTSSMSSSCLTSSLELTTTFSIYQLRWLCREVACEKIAMISPKKLTLFIHLYFTFLFFSHCIQ